MSCIFCKLGAEGTVVRFASQHFWVRFDAHPVSPGHLLVIPKRHVASIGDLTIEEMGLLWQISKQVTSSKHLDTLSTHYHRMLDEKPSANSPWFVRQALNHPRFGSTPDGYNFGFNEGKAAGQTVDHLHWHIIPRYDGDMIDPSGGIRYAIPKMGNYHHPRE